MYHHWTEIESHAETGAHRGTCRCGWLGETRWNRDQAITDMQDHKTPPVQVVVTEDDPHPAGEPPAVEPQIAVPVLHWPLDGSRPVLPAGWAWKHGIDVPPRPEPEPRQPVSVPGHLEGCYGDRDPWCEC